jgi:HAMP domain-containing protein/anti-anti-sigma regulatory factor
MKSIGMRLMIAMAFVTLAAVVAVGWLAFSSSRTALERKSFDKLVAVRELKADQVSSFFNTIRDQVTALSANRMVVEAMVSMRKAFLAAPRALSDNDAANLRQFYNQEFLTRARAAKAPVSDLADLLPADNLSNWMQHHYISSNPHPVGEKLQLDRSSAGTTYDELHGLYHPIFRDYSKRFGFYDLFMVDAETGYIVYSVEKEIDFATSLIDGPYRESNIGDVFNEARKANNANFSLMVDFEGYIPSYGAPASFLSSPIFVNGEVLGVLIAQVPLDRVDAIMTNSRAWSRVGLGETGEAYIVGPDFALRTQSRFLIQKPTQFFDDITKAGTDPTVVDRIRSLESAVGLLKVDTPGTHAALNGRSGRQIFDNYLNQPVLSAYRKLKIRDVEWALLSEMGREEAFADAVGLRDRIVALVVITALLAVGLAWLVARNLVAPVRALSVNANRLAEGDLDIDFTINRGDEIGELAKSFEQMRRSIRELIQRQEEAIEALATPLIPFRQEILIAPMVGIVDQSRLNHLRDSLVESVHRQGARVVIIDLTGVPELENNTLFGIDQVTNAVGLLGAKVIITGLRPEIAAQWANQETFTANALSERSLERGITRALEIVELDRGDRTN